MAVSLMMTNRTFRRHEKVLEELGLISRDTIQNGGRRVVYQNGHIVATAGICLSPALARFSDILRLRDDKRHESEVITRLRTEISKMRRKIIATSSNTHELDQERSKWVAPRLLKDQSAIKAELQRMTKVLQTQAANNDPAPDNTAPAPDKNDPYYKQDTHKKMDVLAKKRSENISQRDQVADDIDFEALATNEAKFYFDTLKLDQSRRDAIRQTLALRSLELGIGTKAYQSCINEFGETIAQSMLMIIDANRHHPTHPVRSPIGLWNRFTNLHRNGMLDIQKSITGIARRMNAA